MSVKEATPQECQALMQEEGYIYLDVRTEPEFEQGHPPGAYNIPVFLRDDATMRMVPNPDFVEEVQAHFPKDTKIVVGCGMGGRSAQAQQMMAEAGYSQVINNLHGWSGRQEGFGRFLPGWIHDDNLPVEQGNPEERNYQAMKNRRT